MDNLINTINEICGDNGLTTYNEIAGKLNVPYTKIRYWVNKYYEQGLLGIIYPGLGMSRTSERYIYNKVCTI